ncbi:CLP protease proteolytic subunit 6 [Actinidia rufa]|uniref:ATP-dependent Clp protease proteolytic subunit n=1 Tax=Actinidia rufa TaxID=165716 RepID=A0A7J0FA47_9ERIC|nr:CLP protease proteolytic subunit 6 [Actinidia rufa]
MRPHVPLSHCASTHIDPFTRLHVHLPHEPLHQPVCQIYSRCVSHTRSVRDLISASVACVSHLGSNYKPWSQAMSNFLKGRKLWRYVTGDIKAPVQAYNLGDLILLMPSGIFWPPDILLLIWLLTPSEPKWVSDVDATLFATYPDQHHLILFLMGLSDVYELVRVSLLHRIPLLTLDQTISKFLSEEACLGLILTSHVDTALAAPGSRGRGPSGGSQDFSTSGAQSSSSTSRHNECKFYHATYHHLLVLLGFASIVASEIKPKVGTICLRIVASQAALLLVGGEKGMKYAMPNARIMIHQPSTGVGVLGCLVCHIWFAAFTGQPLENVQRYTERDRYLSPAEVRFPKSLSLQL